MEIRDFPGIYIEILGTVTINNSQDLKVKFWGESFAKWFNGTEDPNYVFLEIQANTVRILNNQGPPQELYL